MIKAVLLTLGLAAVLALPATVAAQDNASTPAVTEAVLRQAAQITLRGKLADARATAQRGDIVTAAKLYQEAIALTEQIGSGIDDEKKQAFAGLAATRLTLARDAQSRGDLREAQIQVTQVLKADPKNNEAILFKQANDNLMARLKGRIPDPATQDRIPQVIADKTDAGTLVQDGKVLYEAGKLEDAEAKLHDALKLDGDNGAAYYYLNLIKQARYARSSAEHTTDTQERMVQVEKRWVLPVADPTLPVPNPYAENKLIYTGPGRQAIMDKLNRIRFESLVFDTVPLSEVLRILSEKTRLSDPDHKGINFLINPNPDRSGQPVAGGGGAGGGGGGGGPVAIGVPGGAIDPTTGLPAAPAAPAGGGEPSDLANFTVKLNFTDVRLADVLDAIVMVAAPATPGDSHSVRFTITDYAIIFQIKGIDTPQLFMRTFRVDPNTFYSGLQSVSSQAFGASSSGGGQNGGGGNGGGNQRGNQGGNQNGGGGGSGGGGIVGIVDPFGGGSGGGGGGGRGGNQRGGNQRGGRGGNQRGNQGGQGNQNGGGGGGGGLEYITTETDASTPSEKVVSFFESQGVNLSAPPGKTVFFNDRLGLLFVRATENDLDIIERAIQALNQVAPQVHIKSRFIEVQQTDSKALGFDWSLGAFNIGNQAIASGGTDPSRNVPVTTGNPLGAFPGGTGAGIVPPAVTDGLLTGGLRNSGPVLGTLTGILTDPNFRVALHALEQRGGFENLAEPEATTISGRQTQMKATQTISVITDFSFDNGNNGGNNNNAGNGNGNNGNGGNGNVNNLPGAAAIIPEIQSVEVGPVLDVVPYVLSDGYTINLALIPSLTEFDGYDPIPSIPGYTPGNTGSSGGAATLPIVLPRFTIRQVVATVNVLDNQTVVLGGLISSQVTSTKDKVPMLGDLPLVGQLFQSQVKNNVRKNLMIFVTATVVDPAGNRVHSDDQLPFAQSTIPTQPPGAGKPQESVKQVRKLN